MSVSYENSKSLEPTPLLTIIVTSYKNQNYYQECLQSVFIQRYPHIELIISDDGTPDFDRKEIGLFVSRHKESNIVNFLINQNEQNIGIVKNINKAIKLSKGDYIIVLAIDDILNSMDTVSDVVNFFITRKCLIITGYKDTYDERMQNLVKRFPSRKAVKVIDKNDPQTLYKRLCFSNFISGAATPFSREFITKYGFFDDDYVLLEDYPKYLKITRENCNICFLDKPIIKYRLGGISTRSQINRVFIKDIMAAIENEILPFKAKIGFWLYRFNLFKLEQYKRILNGEKRNSLGLFIKFIDVMIYRAIMKIFL